MAGTVPEWREFNRDLRVTCEAVLLRLRERPREVPNVILAGFLSKATRTLSAINLLYANKLEEEAQSLVRILLEVRLNFECFRHMAEEDLPGTCQRLLDCTALEKAKQARASEFHGINAELRAWLEKTEKEVAERYPSEVLSALRRHGFTGLSVEQRATLVGHEAAYNIIYRNFSRNVHSTDHMESFLKAGVLDVADAEKHAAMRDAVSHSTAAMCAARIVTYVHDLLGLGMDHDLQEVRRRYQQLTEPNAAQTLGTRGSY